jgi:hypothetical protein
VSGGLTLLAPAPAARHASAPAASNPTHTHAPIPQKQAKLRAFSAALERVGAAAQRMPPPSAVAMGGLQFGQQALAASTSNMLAAISSFQGSFLKAFPKVAQMGAQLG